MSNRSVVGAAIGLAATTRNRQIVELTPSDVANICAGLTLAQVQRAWAQAELPAFIIKLGPSTFRVKGRTAPAAPVLDTPELSPAAFKKGVVRALDGTLDGE